MRIRARLTRRGRVLAWLLGSRFGWARAIGAGWLRLVIR